MTKIRTYLIGGAIVAWAAYLSWPVTAEVTLPPTDTFAPVSKSAPLTVEAFESTQPQNPTDPSA